MKSKQGLIWLSITILLGTLLMLPGCAQRGAEEPQASKANPHVEYYTCGMHPSVRIFPEEYDKGNVNCPICNMKLIPVYQEDTKKDAREKKILFYRNPMNPAITSSEPATDEMGMDYIPVYEETESDAEYYGCGMEGAEHVFLIKDVGNMMCPICGMDLKKLSKEAADALKGVVSRVIIQGEQVELAGVQTVPVQKLYLYKEIRTVGRVAYDPQLAVTQEEYISALKALDKIREGTMPEIEERTRNLVQSSKRKLQLLGLSLEQIEKLAQSREVQTGLILPEEKMWVYGDVYEYELNWVKQGGKVKVVASSVPGEKFYGTISSVNPVLNPKTRSVTFRAEVDNPGLKLKPEMYVDVGIMSVYTSPEGDSSVLAIPKAAVLDTGMRKMVWVDARDGVYEGREVRLGPEATGTLEGKEEKFYPVLGGVAEGELVVKKANFLIDSQSQLTGTAAAAYGGALGTEEEKKPQVHQH